jgi:wyosine [tRNA(Phe)-imidazoG37] synthetase (radical SAM superfamily)
MNRKFGRAYDVREKLCEAFSEKHKMLLPLKNEIIYGPVNSRRLGRSLGLNILPAGRKICSFNCVYCQYGRSDPQKIVSDKALLWPSPAEVSTALANSLKEMPVSPAYITFSGNGEALLHPHFSEIVEETIHVRNRLAPEAKTAILSNSSLVSDSTVQNVLQKLDVRIMKLDCGLEKNFKLYNQPAGGITLDDIVKGLGEIPDVTIQSLFTKGISGNFSSANIQAWVERIAEIRPLFVQIYTLDRNAPSEDLRATSKADLYGLKSLVKNEGISVEVF